MFVVMVMPVSLLEWWLDYNLWEKSSSRSNGISFPCKSKVEGVVVGSRPT